jgi:hypothetical protein
MILLTPAALEVIDIDDLASRTEMVVGFAGTLRGRSAAAALHCDWLAIEDNATIAIESPQAWGGAVGRIGARAYRLYLLGSGVLNAEEAVREGLVGSVLI